MMEILTIVTLKEQCRLVHCSATYHHFNMPKACLCLLYQFVDVGRLKLCNVSFDYANQWLLLIVYLYSMIEDDTYID